LFGQKPSDGQYLVVTNLGSSVHQLIVMTLAAVVDLVLAGDLNGSGSAGDWPCEIRRHA